MFLTKHQVSDGHRWAVNGRYLPKNFQLDELLQLNKIDIFKKLSQFELGETANTPHLAPVEAQQEIWACGVTYLRSREARKAESDVADVYERVYLAERPELFFKSIGWRAQGHNQPVRIRKDSQWDVPEPEFTLVVNAHQEIVGYCAGNDMSSRSIEGENPLYLPQAKMYNHSCAIGSGLLLTPTPPLEVLPIEMSIFRGGNGRVLRQYQYLKNEKKAARTC